jgi:hypothetical protein
VGVVDQSKEEKQKAAQAEEDPARRRKIEAAVFSDDVKVNPFLQFNSTMSDICLSEIKFMTSSRLIQLLEHDLFKVP